MTKPKTGREIIKEFIETLTYSIWTDQTEGLQREPLGRSDTYCMRNTLQTMLDYGYINDNGTS